MNKLREENFLFPFFFLLFFWEKLCESKERLGSPTLQNTKKDTFFAHRFACLGQEIPFPDLCGRPSKNCYFSFHVCRAMIHTIVLVVPDVCSFFRFSKVFFCIALVYSYFLTTYQYSASHIFVGDADNDNSKNNNKKSVSLFMRGKGIGSGTEGEKK